MRTTAVSAIHPETAQATAKLIKLAVAECVAMWAKLAVERATKAQAIAALKIHAIASEHAAPTTVRVAYMFVALMVKCAAMASVNFLPVA